MITTNDVLSWLAEHPDLLIKHPDLLDHLKLPHDVGATSLIEHQVERLREQNKRLEQRLNALTDIASENEQLIRRLHSLTLALMNEKNVDGFLAMLIDQLHSEFQTDAVQLHLNSGGEKYDDLDQVTIHREWSDLLARLRDQENIECGRLTRAKVSALFGEAATASLQSVAVVPLSGVGLLAIGSEQADRFNPEMGTLFLELLAETLTTRLADQIAQPRKRA